MQTAAYCDLAGQTLSATLGGSGLNLPTLTAGDDVTLRLRFHTQVDGGTWIEQDRDVMAIQAGIGLVDARPTSGTWQLKIDGTETDPLAIDVAAADLAEEIGALAGVVGITAVFEGGSWYVYSPEQIEILPWKSKLRPVSRIHVTETEEDGGWSYEIRLVQRPVAFADQLVRALPPAPVVQRIQEAIDEAGTLRAEVQSLTLNPWFRGIYRIRRGTATTPELSITDGPDEILAAIQGALWTPEELAAGAEFTVTNPADLVYHITFGGEVTGQSFDLLEIDVISSPPGDLLINLPLKSRALRDLLRTKSPLDLEMLIRVKVADDTDAADEDEALRYVTAYRGTVRVTREQYQEAEAVYEDPRWLVPSSPADYRPFSRDNVFFGSRHTTVVIEAPGTTTAELGLDTDQVNLTVYDGDGRVILAAPGNDVAVTLTAPGEVEIVAGAGAVYPVRCVFSAADAAEYFIEGLTVTIPQVTNLREELDGLGNRMSAMEALLPLDAVAARSKEVVEVMRWTLPKRFVAAPWRGTLPDAPGSLAEWKAPGPVKGILLPAVISGDEIGTLTPGAGNLLRDVAPEDHGAIFELAGSAPVLVPGFGGRASAWAEPGALLAGYWDAGREFGGFYRVTRYGNDTATTFYPVDFEVMLVDEIPIVAEAFAVGRTFSLDFGFEAAIVGTDTRAQWHVVVEIAQRTAATGEGVASNYDTIDWSQATPVIDQRIFLSPIPTTHRFAVAIVRKAGLFVTSATIYGEERAVAVVPASADFSIRARLTRWDTISATVGLAIEGSANTAKTADPRGLAVVRGVDVGGDGAGLAKVA